MCEQFRNYYMLYSRNYYMLYSKSEDCWAYCYRRVGHL